MGNKADAEFLRRCAAADYLEPAFRERLIDIAERLENQVSAKYNGCVCCGAEIPEGRQVCPDCEIKGTQRSEASRKEYKHFVRRFGVGKGFEE